MLWAEYVERLREKRHKGTGGETRKKKEAICKSQEYVELLY